MKAFIVQTHGYTHCPEFPTIEEARACLREIVRDELKRCRARFKSGSKHKLSDDCYRVTLGSDQQSAMWSHHCIVVA